MSIILDSGFIIKVLNVKPANFLIKITDFC